MSGKPAARIGDKTAHGGVIVEGSPTVTIGGRPAARIGDNHTCPKDHHGGGPISTGSTTVLINNKPAARITDEAVCRGTDKIVEGDPTVLIG